MLYCDITRGTCEGPLMTHNVKVVKKLDAVVYTIYCIHTHTCEILADTVGLYKTKVVVYFIFVFFRQ